MVRCKSGLNKIAWNPACDVKQRVKPRAGYGFAISRRGAPEVCGKRFALCEKRACGTPDAGCVRSLMRIKNKRTS
jgi:hypothetical protein